MKRYMNSALLYAALALYHAGLNLTAVMLAVRGVTQVRGLSLTAGMDAALSGLAGIGHILLGFGLILLLLQLRAKAMSPAQD